MAKRERRVGYGWPVLLAIGVHIAALMLTIIKWPESEPDPTSSSVVQATLVRAETATDQPQQTEDSAPPASQPEEEDAQEPEESAPAESSEEPAPDSDAEVTDSAVEEAKAEAQRLQEEAQRAAEKRRQAEAEAEKRRQAEAAAEKKRQAEAEAERKRQEEAEAEKKRQAEAEAAAEAERKRQAEAEAERKRQAEAAAEKKRQAEAEAERKRQQALAERAAQANNSSLDSMISDEEQSIANAKQASEAANGFKNLVRRYVEQSWNVPSNASSELRAIVRIQLLPTGELVSATITQSSGNSAFDHSVISAVEKAAPFREMRELDASVRGRFREFNLDFNPEDIR
nr:cell envelope integrity inner membrane protein TolA [Virgibacillus halodenitrificans]